MNDLRIYDVGIDEFRPATQADLDHLMDRAGKWVEMCELVDAGRSMKQLRNLRDKHRQEISAAALEPEGSGSKSGSRRA